MAENSYKNIVENIKNWPLSRKLALGATALLSIILFGLIIFQTNRAEFRPLYTDLAQEEAASVTSWLREQGVPYQLKSNGTSIYVPADAVYETRLNLAGAGLPRRGGVGFEIFDHQNFGVTKFTQKINFQRAMQGELARTISAVEAVKSARVHLVLPENRLLQEQQKPAKASVILDLFPGSVMDANQIQGIIHLVAGSIEGLSKNQVTVVDSSGRILSQTSADDPDMILLPDKLKFKSTLEGRLEERAQSLLDRALGNGNSVVRVTAELDFTHEAITMEEFDPDSLVPRSEQITESQSGQREGGGVPGVESNLRDGQREGGSTASTKSSEIINYEISKTVKQIRSPVGKLKNLTAAVLVAEAAGTGGAEGQDAAVPRTEEQLESIRRMVAGAIGFDTERGDRIEVVSMPFRDNVMEMANPETGPAPYDYVPFVKYLVLLCCAFLLYMVLVRPIVKTLRGESVRQYNQTVSELEDQFSQDVGYIDSSESVRKELANGSVTPAQVIRTWLREG